VHTRLPADAALTGMGDGACLAVAIAAIPPFAGRAPGLCDVGSRHGRRAPLEQPGCVGASGATRSQGLAAFCACLQILTLVRRHRVAGGTRPSPASRCDLQGGLCGACTAGAPEVVWREFRRFGDSRAPAVVEYWRSWRAAARLSAKACVAGRYLRAKPDTQRPIWQQQTTDSTTCMRSRLDFALIRCVEAHHVCGIT
jgi:hypothetical protein